MGAFFLPNWIQSVIGEIRSATAMAALFVEHHKVVVNSFQPLFFSIKHFHPTWQNISQMYCFKIFFLCSSELSIDQFWCVQSVIHSSIDMYKIGFASKRKKYIGIQRNIVGIFFRKQLGVYIFRSKLEEFWLSLSQSLVWRAYLNLET